VRNTHTEPNPVAVESDGSVVVPAEIVEAAGLAPGDPVVLEVSDEEVFVRSRAVAEDEQDATAVAAALADNGNAEEPVLSGGSISEEIDARIDGGGGRVYSSTEEFDAALDAVPLPDEPA
jgi:bifunctional DNA-binding transcriptional regulator/antitoxin component of YhaV-PrlF toxin-antitoxin module